MNAAKAVRVVHTEAGAVFQKTDNGATFSTNLVGARIWKHLTHGLIEDDIVERVSAEFGVARDQVRGDAEQFLEELKRMGLLQENTFDKP
jgi:hypothetical protein